MIILINHLTRMQRGFVCAAGIDLHTVKHVRPVPVRDSLPMDCLARYGGPFDMARSVDLGAARPVPVPPHVEDQLCDPAAARFVQEATPENFWRLLERLSRCRLRDVFGPDLADVGRGRFAAPAGKGLASLGCLRPQGLPALCLSADRDGRPRIRMRLTDGEAACDAPVTDLRLFGPDHSTPDVARVREVAERIRRSKGVILSVGLTRQYRPTPDAPPRHWLQVNNVHLREDPAWQLGAG